MYIRTREYYKVAFTPESEINGKQKVLFMFCTFTDAINKMYLLQLKYVVNVGLIINKLQRGDIIYRCKEMDID